MTDEHWTDRHITQFPHDGEYVGWSECGSHVVAISYYRSAVVEALEEYAETLGKADV